MACRKSDRAKDVRLRIESGDESVRASKWDNALLCAAGHNPYDLVDSAVAAAAQISGKPSAGLCLVEHICLFRGLRSILLIFYLVSVSAIDWFKEAA